MGCQLKYQTINQSINQSKSSSPLLGQRPPAWLLQALRSWANLSDCLQMKPVSLTYPSRSRRHVSVATGNPSPSSLSDILFYRHLTCALPQPFISGDFRPPDTNNSSWVAVDKGLYPLCCSHCGPHVSAPYRHLYWKSWSCFLVRERWNSKYSSVEERPLSVDFNKLEISDVRNT